MKYDNEIDEIYTMPKFEMLSLYWKNYFLQVDQSIQENFWGNLTTLKHAEKQRDPYIQQQKEMGYCFQKGLEAPVSFYQALTWVFANIHRYLAQGTIMTSDVLWPARVFIIPGKHGNKNCLFRVIGSELPKHAIEVNLVPPDIFVEMLAKGFFPIGSAIREHTNQSLAEHDLAHFGGFISSPEYMRAVRIAFRNIYYKMKKNQRLKTALENFNSVYSLRLYYMIEIFTLIPEAKKGNLQELLEIAIDEQVNLNTIITLLEKKAKDPVGLYQYLYRIYDQFYELVNPVGGESRDILNRVRKFNRASRLGRFYTQTTTLDSKFNGSSIYSLYQNGCAALENKRSTHDDFLAALREIHAPFIATLIGTSQLTVNDWVMQAAEEFPDPTSKLYQYLCKSGIWTESHVIYWAYGCPNYTRILLR